MKDFLMGIDFGTGGCKTTVIDRDGNIQADAFEEYPSEHPHPGWSEQDPAQWILAFHHTVKNCLAQGVDAARIAGIGISASAHNAVLLDENFQVLRPCIMWNDQRSTDQVRYLTDTHGPRIFEIGMQVPTATWTLPQLLWVKENDPERFHKIRRLLFVKDYVRWYVTGDYGTDPVDAQGSLLYDARGNEWSSELCGMIGLDPQVLPPIRGSKTIAGGILGEVAQRTGLVEGTPVIVGCSDTAAEDYSAGAVEDGQVLVKLATAGNVNVVFQNPHPHPKGYTYPYSVDGMWYMVNGTNTSAACYRWLRDAFYGAEKEQGRQTGRDVYSLMNEDAAKVPVGSGGLIFHPYLLGERCPYFNANARANFFGVGVTHGREHFSRAVLEGVAYSLYDCFQVVREMGVDTREIYLIGGGAKSPLWCQIISDVFGLPVLRPQKDDSSFGSALLAGVGVGLFSNEVSAVRRCNQIVKTYLPDAENHARYMGFFKVYQDIVRAATPIWDRLRTLVDNG